MTKAAQIEHFDIINGLGTISFSPKLIANIIQTVLASFDGYKYVTHTLESLEHNYYEFSISIETPTKEIDYKTIDKIQNEFLLVIKQSLNLSCVVVLNIYNE